MVTAVMDDRAVGQALRVIRERKGLRLEDISSATGLRKNKLSKMERGETVIRTSDVDLYAQACGVPHDAIIELARLLWERMESLGLNVRWEQTALDQAFPELARRLTLMGTRALMSERRRVVDDRYGVTLPDRRVAV